jgi:hypothetical protein
MTEREPLSAQPSLDLGAQQPGLEPRGEGDRVDGDHPVEAAEIERHGACEPVCDGLDAAHDARSAAERDDRHAGLSAGRQHRPDLLRRTRVQDEIGRARSVSGAQPDEVGIGASCRVSDPGLAVVADMLGAD